MSCRRYQEELSLNLDGRLPGARRAAVLAHVDTCAQCAQVWDELQSTQSLLFDIEPPAVSLRFRDQVWDRIHSGEGSTEILLQEPVAIGTKLRYGLVGAAAAALFVVGLQFVTEQSNPAIETSPEVAQNSPEPQPHKAQTGDSQTGDSQTGDSQPGDSQPGGRITGTDAPIARVTQDADRTTDSRPDTFRRPSAPFAPPTLTAGHLASETVERVASAAKQLRLYRGRILQKQPLNRTHQQQVQRCVRTIEGGVFVLERFQRKDLLVLESSSQECLAAARNIINIHGGDTQSKVYNLVRTLDHCQLDRLNEISYKVKLRQFQDQVDPLAEMLLDVGFRNMLKYVAPRQTGTMLSLMFQYSGNHDQPIRIQMIPSSKSWIQESAPASAPQGAPRGKAPQPRKKRLQKRN